jgi:hypothetical protein
MGYQAHKTHEPRQNKESMLMGPMQAPKYIVDCFGFKQTFFWETWCIQRVKLSSQYTCSEVRTHDLEPIISVSEHIPGEGRGGRPYTFENTIRWVEVKGLWPLRSLNLRGLIDTDVGPFSIGLKYVFSTLIQDGS